MTTGTNRVMDKLIEDVKSAKSSVESCIRNNATADTTNTCVNRLGAAVAAVRDYNDAHRRAVDALVSAELALQGCIVPNRGN